MIELHYDRRGEMAIDNMEDLIRLYPQFASRAIKSAMKSEGWRLKNAIQHFIRSRGEGEWDDLNPHTGVLSRSKGRSGFRQWVKNTKMVWRGPKGNKKRVSTHKGVMLSTRQAPLAKWAGGIRYVYDDDTDSIQIGFINRNTIFEKLVKKHAEGFKVRLTPRARKFLFALGFPIKKETKSFEVPARPIIDPVFDKEQSKVFPNISAKFLKNIDRYKTEALLKGAKAALKAIKV